MVWSPLMYIIHVRYTSDYEQYRMLLTLARSMPLHLLIPQTEWSIQLGMECMFPTPLHMHTCRGGMQCTEWFHACLQKSPCAFPAQIRFFLCTQECKLGIHLAQGKHLSEDSLATKNPGSQGLQASICMLAAYVPA